MESRASNLVRSAEIHNGGHAIVVTGRCCTRWNLFYLGEGGILRRYTGIHESERGHLHLTSDGKLTEIEHPHG